MKGFITVLLLLVDAIGSIVSIKLIYGIRFGSGIFSNPLPAELLLMAVALTMFWWTLFALYGMYRTPVALSRFDEVVRCVKAVFIGIFVLYIITFDSSNPVSLSRVFLITYGFILIVIIGLGRLIVRNYQRRLRDKHIGLWNAVVVGFNDVGRQLHDQLHTYPVWGFNVVGFVDADITKAEHHGARIIGKVEELPDIIRREQIQWILIAPEKHSKEALLKVFDHCSTQRVRFLIVADYYHMVVGMMRTIQMHGLPLVEVVPQLVSTGVLALKRATDILIGLIMSLILVIALPIIALLVKLNIGGSVFTRTQLVGRNGEPICLIRFRTNRDSDESNLKATTFTGRMLSRWQINDLPLFFNVLKGEMSLVGPSPEKQSTVKERQVDVPLYNRRFRIRPGLTGWTQLREKSGQSPKDPLEKTGYDLFYVDHMSPVLDTRIILTTIWIILKGEW